MPDRQHRRPKQFSPSTDPTSDEVMLMRVDIKNRRFGRLIAINPTPDRDSCQSVIWKCKCDCGNTILVSARQLTSKTGTHSCGCLQKEKARKNLEENHKSGRDAPAYKHGKYKSRIYNTWINMKARCYNPNATRFLQYGGRGIKVCEMWKKDFQAFYDWAVLNGYQDNLTIDRIDNNGDYTPDNCRWVDNKRQQNNTSHSRMISYGEKTQTLQEWSAELGINYKTLQKRLNAWDIEKALSYPVKSRSKE